MRMLNPLNLWPSAEEVKQVEKIFTQNKMHPGYQGDTCHLKHYFKLTMAHNCFEGDCERRIARIK